MRSLRDLPAETARGLIGVAFDVDDTVTRDGRLEPEAFHAMHALADAGLNLVAVTGRPIGWADVLARQWPVAVAVGENGAGWIWRSGERICEGYAAPAGRRAAYGELFARIRGRVAAELPHVKESTDQWARRCDLAFDIGETVTLPRPDVDALVRLIEGEGAASSVSSVHAHAIPGAWDKATGIVQAVRDALGIVVEDAPARWLFIGDSPNDGAAFAYFPVSVGVANVRDALPRLATPPAWVTAADRGRGFAEMAARVLALR